jgi:hypothetical protein
VRVPVMFYGLTKKHRSSPSTPNRRGGECKVASAARALRRQQLRTHACLPSTLSHSPSHARVSKHSRNPPTPLPPATLFSTLPHPLELPTRCRCRTALTQHSPRTRARIANAPSRARTHVHARVVSLPTAWLLLPKPYVPVSPASHQLSPHTSACPLFRVSMK